MIPIPPHMSGPMGQALQELIAAREARLRDPCRDMPVWHTVYSHMCFSGRNGTLGVEELRQLYEIMTKLDRALWAEDDDIPF